MPKRSTLPKGWTTPGLIREYYFVIAALKKNWVISKPLHHQSPYDFIIDTGDEIARVEVKSIYMRRSSPSRLKERPNDKPRPVCEVRQSAVKGCVRYPENAWDYLAAVAENGDVYLIPRHVIGDHYTVSFKRGDHDQYKM